MAVDLMGFPKIDEQIAVQEAASQGIKSMDHLIRLLSHQPSHSDCTNLTDVTVSKFKKIISLLNRTGHARFRKGPSSSSSSILPPPSSAPPSKPALPPSTSRPQVLDQKQRNPPVAANPVPASFASPPQIITPVTVQQAAISSPATVVATQPQSVIDFTRPNVLISNGKSTELEFTTKDNFSVSSNSSFLSSAITGDCSVSNGKQGSSLFLTPPAPATSTGKPPLSSAPLKKRCHDHLDHSEDASGKCHCMKKRKDRVKKTIRVPAISPKVADIPADEYSWRKYGQKPIKGSPYPR